MTKKQDLAIRIETLEKRLSKRFLWGLRGYASHAGIEDDEYRRLLESLNAETAAGFLYKSSRHLVDGVMSCRVFSFNDIEVDYEGLTDDLTRRFQHIDQKIMVSQYFPLADFEAGRKVMDFTGYSCFDDNAKSSDVISIMEGDGARPATLCELIAFANADCRPCGWLLKILVALGSIHKCGNTEEAVSLHNEWRSDLHGKIMDPVRRLYLADCNVLWSPPTCFLGVVTKDPRKKI